jgi:DNA-binding MarR family transcriptional regulator
MTNEPAEASRQDPRDALTRASTAGLGVVLRSLAPALEQVTLQQYRVLALLVTRGPMRANDLAAELGVLPSGITRIVNRLVRTSFVERRASKLSSREILIAARTKAANLVEAVFATRKTMFAEILRPLSSDDRATVGRAAGIFADAAEQQPSLDAALLLAVPPSAAERKRTRRTHPPDDAGA